MGLILWPPPGMFWAMRKFALVFCLLAACTPIQAQRGQIVSDDEIKQLNVGTTAKAEVTALLGSPTTTDPFDDSQWYYIGEDTKQIGIHPPMVVVRRVLSLKFDANGTLTDEKILSEKDAQKIASAPGQTVVVGKEPTVVQQLIGNVGRFNDTGKADSQ